MYKELLANPLIEIYGYVLVGRSIRGRRLESLGHPSQRASDPIWRPGSVMAIGAP